MADEVNPLAKELGVTDTSNIGAQNYAGSEADNLRMKDVFKNRGVVENERHLVLEQVPNATVFNQTAEDKAHAEAYLAKYQQQLADAAKFEAENEKAKADQLAREAEVKAITDAAAAALAANSPTEPNSP
jgi:hypothetical protein